jgi:hypothetical protein
LHRSPGTGERPSGKQIAAHLEGVFAALLFWVCSSLAEMQSPSIKTTFSSSIKPQTAQGEA